MTCISSFYSVAKVMEIYIVTLVMASGCLPMSETKILLNPHSHALAASGNHYLPLLFLHLLNTDDI